MLKKVISLLVVVVALFAFGCGESQKEKFDRIEKEIVATNAAGMHETQKAVDEKNYKKMMELADKNMEKLEKLVTELEKAAKGNKELESKASEKRIWHEQQKILLEQGRANSKKAGVLK